MKQIQATLLGVALVSVTCALAWWSGVTPDASARSRVNRKIQYIRLQNATPSPAWSPNSRYLAFHALLANTPSYKLRRYRRRHLRRSSPSRYRRLRRSSPSRYRRLRRSSPSRIRTRGAMRLFKNRRYRRLRRSSPSRHMLRRSKPSYTRTLYPMDTHVRSSLAVLDVYSRRVRRFHYHKLVRGTHSRAAYFHPQWSGNELILTSSGFSQKGLFVPYPSGPMRLFPFTMATASFGPQGRMIVGRIHQTGVFLTLISKPSQRYAVVDSRRKIRGAFPRFSPNGRFLAWIDAGTSYTAAPLKVFHVPFTADTLQEHAKGRVKNPWGFSRKRYKALQLPEMEIPTATSVVEFAWGVDSQSIAFVRGRAYKGYGKYQYRSRGLYWLSLAKGRTMRKVDARGENPSFSQQGHLFYNHSHGGIWRWDPRSNKRQRLLAYGYAPQISPNGRHLAFLRWMPSRVARNRQLYLGVLRIH